MNTKIKFIITVIITVLIGIIIYIALHELGHTLIAVACGARITKFSIINARMSYEGGIFTQVAISLFHVAGAIFPLLLAAISLCIYKRNAKSMIYHFGYFFFTIISTFSVLAWVIIPIVALVSEPPAGDDVTKFLLWSGLPPLAVSIGALLIVMLMIAWVFFKRLPTVVVQIIKTVQQS